ncbi:hypothetical protein, partial [Paenibacillus phoenicis]|uniref:hypothetical protein n=1 Tax=Paenibacillus phoenicis TaxID=554117 RepID=UPI003D2DEAE2
HHTAGLFSSGVSNLIYIHLGVNALTHTVQVYSVSDNDTMKVKCNKDHIKALTMRGIIQVSDT